MWLERFKTGLLVVVLTGLIWFFANQADLDSTRVRVVVEVRPENGDLAIIASDPAPLEFEVDVRAPRAVIRDVTRETQVRAWREVYVLDRNVTSGKQVFDSQRVVSQLEAIRQRGLTVTSVNRPSFTLDIDAFVTRPLRVEPVFGDLLVDADKPVPETVQVRLPKSWADAWTSESLPVDVTRYIQDTGQTERTVSRRVSLQWPQPVSEPRLVRFEPADVLVRFRLRGQLVQRDFNSVQVKVIVQPDMQQYDVVPVEQAEFRPDIKVRGSRQVIDNLKPDQIRLGVEIFSTDEASVGATVTRQVRPVDWPEGVQIVGPWPEVRFALKKVEPAS